MTSNVTGPPHNDQEEQKSPQGDDGDAGAGQAAVEGGAETGDPNAEDGGPESGSQDQGPPKKKEMDKETLEKLKEGNTIKKLAEQSKNPEQDAIHDENLEQIKKDQEKLDKKKEKQRKRIEKGQNKMERDQMELVNAK